MPQLQEGTAVAHHQVERRLEPLANPLRRDEIVDILITKRKNLAQVTRAAQTAGCSSDSLHLLPPTIIINKFR